MNIHLIKKQTIEDFVVRNALSKSSFGLWLTAVKFADWNQPADIKGTFNSADLLGNNSNRFVFDIGGNNYRMKCKYSFGEKQVHLFICWIGTHAEYDELCSKNHQYTLTFFKRLLWKYLNIKSLKPKNNTRNIALYWKTY